MARVGSVSPSPYAGPASRPGRPAGRSPRVAGASAVEDQQVAEHGPVSAREERTELVLDLDRVLLAGPPEPPGQPADMGVDGDPGDSKALPRTTLRSCARHRAASRLGWGCRGPGRHTSRRGGTQPEQRLGLRAEEAGRADQLLQLGAIGRPRGPRAVGIPGEKGWGDGVDPDVGGLGRQDGRDEQAKGDAKSSSQWPGVALKQEPVDPAGPAGPGQIAFLGEHANSVSPRPTTIQTVRWPNVIGGHFVPGEAIFATWQTCPRGTRRCAARTADGCPR